VATLLQFDALGVIQQRFGAVRFQRDGGVEIVRLILRPQRRRAVEEETATIRLSGISASAVTAALTCSSGEARLLPMAI
jgi:hypothetical protein